MAGFLIGGLFATLAAASYHTAGSAPAQPPGLDQVAWAWTWRTVPYQSEPGFRGFALVAPLPAGAWGDRVREGPVPYLNF